MHHQILHIAREYVVPPPPQRRGHDEAASVLTGVCVAPCGQTALHVCPRSTKYVFVVYMKPRTRSEIGVGLHMPLLPAPCAPEAFYYNGGSPRIFRGS